MSTREQVATQAAREVMAGAVKWKDVDSEVAESLADAIALAVLRAVVPCPDCGGRGWIHPVYEADPAQVPCPRCNAVEKQTKAVIDEWPF